MAEEQRERQSAPWSAYAAEGISSSSPGDRDQAQEIRELRQQVQDLTRVLEAISLAQAQPPERDVHPGWSSDRWRSWKDNWWDDRERTSSAGASNWWDDGKSSWDFRQDSDHWAPSFSPPSRKWDVSEPPTFPGLTANYLVWRKAVLRWKMTTDHPVEKLGNKVMNSLEGILGWENLHGSPSAARRCGVNFEGLGCQGLLDPRGRVQASPPESTLQRGKRQRRVPTTVHDKEVGEDRGGLSGRSGHHANSHLGTVLKKGVVKAVRRLLNGAELGDGARALNMLDVDTQEGIIKAAAKPVVHSFMETGGSSGDQQCEEEKEETDGQSGEKVH